MAVCLLLYPKIFKADKFENIRDEDGRISVAVMPFQNMTNDTLWDVYQDIIQDVLITNLSNSTELSVRQFQTMHDILQSTEKANYSFITTSVASDISQKLQANTFIDGSIKAAGGKIYINAHLSDTDTEEVIERRLQNALAELKIKDKYDYDIINENIEVAYAQLKAVYTAETLKIVKSND